MRRHGALREFLVERHPGRRTASAALRLVFAGMFLSQVAIAMFTSALTALLSGGAPGGASSLGPVLAALALVQCVVGFFLPDVVARAGGKGRVLSATLLSAVLLAAPGWYLMLALLTGQHPLSLLTIAGALAGGYGLGFVLTGRFAKRVTRPASGGDAA